MARWLVLVCLVVLGCTESLGLDERCFPCVSDLQCGGALVCDLTIGACVLPGEDRCRPKHADAEPGDLGFDAAPDVLDADAAPDVFDAGVDPVDVGAPDVGPPGCGNGVVESGEACDDGNDDEHDRCTADCKLTCGMYLSAFASFDHTMLLRQDRTLWMMGRNRDGTLGDGTHAHRFRPINTLPTRRFTSVKASRYATFAIEEDGTLWVFGSNLKGELGFEPTGQRIPIPAHFGVAGPWAELYPGERTVFGRTTSGQWWVWARDAYSEMGRGQQSEDPLLPMRWDPGGLVELDGHFKKTMGLAANGDVHLWGNPLTRDEDAEDDLSVLTSTRAKVFGLPPVEAISLGYTHAMALDRDGRIWTWGKDGRTSIGGTEVRPRLLDSATDWVAIEATWENSLAIKRDGSLWGWGSNELGVLGTGNTVRRVAPTRVTDVGTSMWRSISAHRHHAVGIQSDGSAWVIGNNDWGQLGYDDRRSTPVPLPIHTCDL